MARGKGFTPLWRGPYWTESPESAIISAYYTSIQEYPGLVANARYVHTNLVAADWRALAGFYQRVFGCTPVPPERDFCGPALEAATAIPGAHLRGVHLRLPGWGPDGPTLELFQYEPEGQHLPPAANRPGFGHLAFQVPDVAEARAEVQAAGGCVLGEMASLATADGRVVTFVYVTDPEGNILELQSWSEGEAPVR